MQVVYSLQINASGFVSLVSYPQPGLLSIRTRAFIYVFTLVPTDLIHLDCVPISLRYRSLAGANVRSNAAAVCFRGILDASRAHLIYGATSP